MRGREFLEKLEHVEPQLVEEAGRGRTPRRRRRGLWISALAAALALAFLAGVLLQSRAGGETVTGRAQALALAVYPEMAQYPDESRYWDAAGNFDDDGFMEEYDAWWTERRARIGLAEGKTDGLEAFCAATLPVFLTGEGGENRVYAPLNVYLTLGMLTELTGGDSRQQLLDLLGAEDTETLRAAAQALWNANYCDDGAGTSLLAASLWLDQETPFVQETVDGLAEHYYASVYQGEMGSEEMNEALRAWLSEQTDGLLEQQAEGVELDAETVLALAATIGFRARWRDEFREENTAQGVFRSPAGELKCDFMHQSGTGTYYWGDRFSAIRRGLAEGGEMWLLLPDEGVRPEELLESGEAMAFLAAGGEWTQSKRLIVNQALPKFDIAGETDLIPGLKALGVTGVFDPAAADFTPMTGGEQVFVSQARHAARAAIDEEGITAAAYTVMRGAGSAEPPEEEVDFVADRPFLFAVNSPAGQLLFAGIVNQPQM